MAEDRDTEARWYVVHTYSGYENKVAQNLETIVENRRLQELIHEVKVPVELVPDEEVDKLGVDVREVSLDYAVGDNVQIMNGPLEGFIGIVEGIDTDAKKVNVKVSMYGRETPAQLDYTQVKPL